MALLVPESLSLVAKPLRAFLKAFGAMLVSARPRWLTFGVSHFIDRTAVKKHGSGNYRIWRVGPHYFCGPFKKRAGVSPCRYSLCCRMDRAKELLRSPQFT